MVAISTTHCLNFFPLKFRPTPLRLVPMHCEFSIGVGGAHSARVDHCHVRTSHFARCHRGAASSLARQRTWVGELVHRTCSSAQGTGVTETNRYTYNGFGVAYSKTPATAPLQRPTPALVLVHGFGSSKSHFRRLLAPEAFPGMDVYAIDLLGFGESEKPTTTAYTMRLYRDQILHFLETQVPQGTPVHLVGNSIGSLATLMVGASKEVKTVDLKSLILLNCAGGLNNKGALAKADWRIKLALPIFWLIDTILKSPLGPKIFDNVRSEENLRQVLTNLYPSNPSAVDAELVQGFVQPAEDPNAFHVFREIYTTDDAGPYPLDILDDVGCSILLLWGTADTLTPSNGPVGRALRRMAEDERPDCSFVDIDGAGHVFFDERPVETIKEISQWVARF